MNPDLLVTPVVLGAALLHAAWNALVKIEGDRVVTIAVMASVWSVLGAALLVVAVPLPAPESWPFVLASVALHTAYLVSLLAMYREGDLSQVYPISRGSAPILLAFLSMLTLGELLSPLEWLGVAIISVGVLSLTFGGRMPGDGRTIAAALFTGLLIVCYTLADGMGVRRTELALSYSAAMFWLQGLPWVGVLLWIRLRGPERLPAHVVRLGGLAGVLSMTAYGSVIWALSRAPMAPVAALRETGVVFAALIGTIWLGERFGRRRIVASVLVAAGVALLNWPG